MQMSYSNVCVLMSAVLQRWLTARSIPCCWWSQTVSSQTWLKPKSPWWTWVNTATHKKRTCTHVTKRTVCHPLPYDPNSGSLWDVCMTIVFNQKCYLSRMKWEGDTAHLNYVFCRINRNNSTIHIQKLDREQVCRGKLGLQTNRRLLRGRSTNTW